MRAESKMAPKTLSLIALALALAGCGTSNRGMESVHQPIVQRTDYVIDLASAGSGLASGEQERLDGWFRSIGLAYGDRVAIDDPSGGASGDVAELLARRGMSIYGAAPVTAGRGADGSVRVVVSRASATVPGCPDWSRPSAPDFVGSTMSNYGCANNAALAAMIADPLDLISGREPGRTTDPAIATKAIDAFRAARPTGAQGIKSESTSKVGK
jgi:pilus assembly protein CpaD